MIIPVSGRGYAGDFAAIYNSANTLFPLNEKTRGLICRWNMTEKAWENILMKKS